MPLSHILINLKDNVIRRNKRPLIKPETDNDMDNDTETKPKTRDSTSATESEKCMSLERMQLNFKKHQAAQLDQEEELSNLGMANREQ